MEGILTLEQVKEIWVDKFKHWKENELFNIYIDNPFCASRCEFCIHFGCKTAIYSDIYKLYYNDYLPRNIEMYKDILQMRVPDSVYFGGGTPSMMTKDIMKSIMQGIPNFIDIKEKSFESHPAFLTKEKIDVLADFKFTFLSLGIQTFDEKTNKEQDRIYVNPDKVKLLVDYAQNEKGINVNCDLLAYTASGDLKDLDMIKSDLDILFNYIKPNIITIYPMYQRFSYDFQESELSGTESQKERSVELKYELNKVLSKAVRHAPDYSFERPICLVKEEIKYDLLEDMYILRIPREEFETRVKKYSCSCYPVNPENQNVIGIGGFGTRLPYSYQGKKLYYLSKNNGWKTEFIYDERINSYLSEKYK